MIGYSGLQVNTLSRILIHHANTSTDIYYCHGISPESKIVYGSSKGWLRQKKRILAVVDRPKGATLTALVAHPSQDGWNLPREHDRHFLQFPLGAYLIMVLVYVTDHARSNQIFDF